VNQFEDMKKGNRRTTWDMKGKEKRSDRFFVV